MGFQMAFITYVSIILAFVATQLLYSNAQRIGVNYGTIGNNLPPPADVISLFKRNGINFIRIYDPNPDILNALRGSGIQATVGMKNEDIPSIAADPAAATSWVNTNIVQYKDSNIIFVVVGNEVIPGPFAANVAQAMTNIKNALNSVGLSGVKVSTTTAFNLQKTFPPSAGAFPPETAQIMSDVTRVLREDKSPLLVSVYPYYAYVAYTTDISFEYASFTATTPVVDGQLQYFNLFDAQIDAYYAALAAIGAGDICIIIAESGWPTAGREPFTSVANAQTYNTNLIKRVKSGKGTPRTPSVPLDTFIFSTFDENKKQVGIEQNWGVFSPNMEPKYPLTF